MNLSEQEAIISMLKLTQGFYIFPFTYMGYDCLIMQTDNFSHKTLCGYVGVTKGHQYFGKLIDDIDICCHGGVTFTCYGDDTYRPEYNAVGEKLYWFGFDCGHYNDIDFNTTTGEMIMKRTPEFVAREIFDMVHQLHDMPV